MLKSKSNLDYGLIKEQMNRLLQSVPNKLEREWQAKAPTEAAYAVVLGTTTAASNTFKTIGFLCVENPKDWRHRPEMALAIPALARTILDALYNSIFLFEDLSPRADWYMRAGWREFFEIAERAKRDYASDPDWSEYFARSEPSLEKMSKLIGKPAEELRSAERWPTPLQMKRHVKNSTTMAFFAYLDDWYYREFSQISHGSLPGLVHTAGALRDLAKGDTAKLDQARGHHLMQVVTILITFYSEIEAELKIGVTADLQYVWQMLKEHYSFAKEIYDRREYSRRLI